MIAVQLPSPVVARTNNDYLADAYIWLAILYILDRADRLAGPGCKPRLVINVSFGCIAGPHDGSGLLETHMDRLIESREGLTQIVLAAGNAHLSRCHAVVDLAAKGPVEFDWVVQPGDRTHSLLQVWLPGPGDPDVNRLEMTVKTPEFDEETLEGDVLSIAEKPDAWCSAASDRGIYAALYAAQHPNSERDAPPVRALDHADRPARAARPAGRLARRLEVEP